jgi:hypothetical protein
MDTLPTVDPAALRSAYHTLREQAGLTRPTRGARAIMSETTYTELEKLDAFLGLPPGTARATIANYDRSRVGLMNERLAAATGDPNLRLDDDTAVARACRPAWKALMQKLKISNAWWMDGNPHRIKPVDPSQIPSLDDLDD